MDIEPAERRVWTIPGDSVDSQGAGSAPPGREAVVFANPGQSDAHLRITVYCPGRGPIGPCHLLVPAGMTAHFTKTDLAAFEAIPEGAACSYTVVSDTPIILQYTGLDARQAETVLPGAEADAAG